MTGRTDTIPTLNGDEAELNRQLIICNACRYCETYCVDFIT